MPLWNLGSSHPILTATPRHFRQGRPCRCAILGTWRRPRTIAHRRAAVAGGAPDPAIPADALARLKSHLGEAAHP